METKSLLLCHFLWKLCNRKTRLQDEITRFPYGLRSYFYLKKLGGWFAIGHDNYWLGGILWNSNEWLNILLRSWTFWHGMVYMSLNFTLKEQKPGMLRCISDLGNLQLALHSQLPENLRRSWGPFVYQEVVGVVPIDYIGLYLRLFPWNLSLWQGWSNIWLWYPLFSVVEKSEWVVTPI